MFTGIVQAIGTVVGMTRHDADISVDVDVARLGLDDVTVGDSISVSGCCLTVVRITGNNVRFDISGETVLRTLLGDLSTGSAVNLEKAMAVSDRLGGHLVSGHVDGLAELVSSGKDGRSTRLRFRVPPILSHYVAEKGSVTLDGVSLTVNDVEDTAEGAVFGVNLVPHTLTVTTLGKVQRGGQLHVEVDIIARYLERLLQSR